MTTSTDILEPTITVETPTTQTLRESVHTALQRYLVQLDGYPTAGLYNLVLSEVEIPMLETVMRFTRGNQSKAAILLGISRGTLRKKLKQYDLENLS